MLTLLAVSSCVTHEPIRTAADDAPSKAQSSAGPPLRGRTSEEVGALNVATHRKYIARIQAQNRDEEWAAKTELVMRKEMPALLEKTATFIDVDCRTNACLISLEWRSFIVAQGNWERLLLGVLSVECDREITLPNPEDPMRPYREMLVMANCKR
jgi:hypothetical protein